MSATRPVVGCGALVLALGVACGHAPAPPPAASPDDPILRAGRRWTAAFYTGDTQPLWDRMAEPLQRLFGSKAGLDDFRRRAVASLGPERGLLKEEAEAQGEVTRYLRTARFAAAPGPVLVTFAFDAAGRIAGFAVVAAPPTVAAPTGKLDYRTRTPLRLPFDGAWTVAWGGRTLEQNQHVVARDQRFAYDFLIRRGGTTHAGSGTRNADYFCYGAPVLAPGAGRIVAAAGDVPENVPGAMDVVRPLGNHVVIDHGNGEFSFLAHLQPGSLRVAVGDQVTAGQTIGLPAQFHDYAADGHPIPLGEPFRGQTVQRLSL